jgi:hypothetical protein
MKFKKMFMTASLTALFMAGVATSCSDEGGYQGIKPAVPTDTSKPITIKGFSPKEGGVRTQMFIEGSNFGTDVSKIEVIIGGVPAPVIGSSGSKICAMVPRRCNAGDVVVKIYTKDGKLAKEHSFGDDLFTLHSSLQVNTLVGKIDPQTNTSSNVDGTFEEAEFIEPWWIEFDMDPETGEKVIYCMDQENLNALRKINLTAKEVSTVFMKGQSGIYRAKSMLFDSSTRDTLFFIDDNGKGNWVDRHALPNIFYSIRSENFRKVYPYIYGNTAFSAASMNDGTFFYNTYYSTQIVKAKQVWDPVDQMWDPEILFSVRANANTRTFLNKHPDDLYVYVTGEFHAVYKCAYNKQTKMLESPAVHVGSLTAASGYADLPGTSARFNIIRQGVFVKNKEYVAQGKEDVYDFYVCDYNNHCIRKITPDGEVSTFAGRGSQDLTSKINGWIDGDARETAQFNNPNGICYDEEEETFYVADNKNKRIRTISVE